MSKTVKGEPHVCGVCNAPLDMSSGSIAQRKALYANPKDYVCRKHCKRVRKPAVQMGNMGTPKTKEEVFYAMVTNAVYVQTKRVVSHGDITNALVGFDAASFAGDRIAAAYALAEEMIRE